MSITLTKTGPDTAVKVWNIDAEHSFIRFRIRHLSVMWVNGTFREFEGRMIQKKDDFEDSEIFFKAKAMSIETGVVQRDRHLRSDDFFGVKQYPDIIFQSLTFAKLDESNYELHGKLTIRDKTHKVKLDVTFNGSANDEYEREKVSFLLQGKMSRKEFGLKWGGVTETGGVIAGDEVQIICDVQLILDPENRI